MANKITVGTGTPVDTQKQAARQALAKLDASLDALTTGWNALDAAGKQAALRQGLIVALRIIKHLARSSLL